MPSDHYSSYFGPSCHCSFVTIHPPLTVRATRGIWLAVILSRSPLEQWVSQTQIGQPVWLEPLTGKWRISGVRGIDQIAPWSSNSLSHHHCVILLAEWMTWGWYRYDFIITSPHSRFRYQTAYISCHIGSIWLTIYLRNILSSSVYTLDWYYGIASSVQIFTGTFSSIFRYFIIS